MLPTANTHFLPTVPVVDGFRPPPSLPRSIKLKMSQGCKIIDQVSSEALGEKVFVLLNVLILHWLSKF